MEWEVLAMTNLGKMNQIENGRIKGYGLHFPLICQTFCSLNMELITLWQKLASYFPTQQQEIL